MADLNAVLAKLKTPDHAELVPFLRAVSSATAEKQGEAKGLDMGRILALLIEHGPLISALFALFKGATGGSGKPAELPSVPDVPEDDEEEDGPAKPVPAARTIAGIHTARWFHFQEGDPGKVKPIHKSRFDAIVTGSDPLNGDLKSRLVSDVTPLLSDGTKLLKGMPENALVKVRYAVIFDGERFEGDDIANSPVTVNNMDANFGLTPRYVLGPGIEGKHSFAAEVNVNDTGWVRIKATQAGAVEELRIG